LYSLTLFYGICSRHMVCSSVTRNMVPLYGEARREYTLWWSKMRCMIRFSRVCISEYFRNHRHTYRKAKYYILFQMRLECVLLVVALASRKQKYVLHCTFFSLLFSIRFIPPCRKLFYLRSSFHHEQSWLIANAIITLKTTRHVGTESRKIC